MIDLICPNCKNKINSTINPYHCPSCNSDYPIVENIPLMFNKEQMVQYRESIGSVQEYYRNVAGIYGISHHVDMPGAKRFIEELENKTKPYWKDNLRVLEIGSGTGFATNVFSKHANNTVATDASLEMLILDKHSHTEIDMVCCPMENLPFPDDYFDLVIGNNTFYLNPDKKEGAKSISRVLKSGGRLILSEMNPYNPLWPIMFTIKGRWFEKSIYQLFKSKMRKYFSAAGMEIEDCDYYSYSPYFAGNLLLKFLGILKALSIFKFQRRFNAVRIWFVIRKK